MMAKDFFVNALLRHKDLTEKVSKVSDALNQLSPEVPNFFCMAEHDSLVMDCLKNAMNDQDDYISWWVYEAEYGTRFPCLVTKDDMQWDLSEPGALYEFLVEQYADKLD